MGNDGMGGDVGSKIEGTGLHVALLGRMCSRD